MQVRARVEPSEGKVGQLKARWHLRKIFSQFFENLPVDKRVDKC